MPTEPRYEATQYWVVLKPRRSEIEGKAYMRQEKVEAALWGRATNWGRRASHGATKSIMLVQQRRYEQAQYLKW